MAGQGDDAVGPTDGHVLSSPFTDAPIPDTDLYSTAQPVLRARPQALALHEVETGVEYTFEALRLAVRALAGSLYHSLGVRPGDRVAVCAPNSAAHVIMLGAVLRAGGVIVCANFLLTPDDIRAMLQQTRAVVMFTDTATATKVKAACSRTDVKNIIVAGGAEGCVTFDSLLHTNDTWRPAPELHTFNINPGQQEAVILFSSGTTGPPKPVLLSHRNFTAIVAQFSHPDVRQLTPVQAIYQPMGHVFGITLALFVYLMGTTTYVISRFNLDTYLSIVHKYQIPMIHVVPPVAVMISNGHLADKYDLSCIRQVGAGAGPISADIERRMKIKLRSPEVVFRMVYGLTEMTGCVTAMPRSTHPCGRLPRPPGTVGVLLPNTQLKVVCAGSGAVQGAGHQGELWVRGPQQMVGYLGLTDATAATVDAQGWLHTGDIGYYDENGFVFVVDRLKELIKYKGYQVAPVELESVLYTHRAVDDAGVFSVPDEMAGELPRAWVVLKKGATATPDQLMDYVRERVAPFKRLRGGVRVVCSIPRSASGKIIRRTMQAMDRLTPAATSKI